MVFVTELQQEASVGLPSGVSELKCDGKVVLFQVVKLISETGESKRIQSNQYIV